MLTSKKLLTADEEFRAGSYLFITAGTFQKREFMLDDNRKQLLAESLDFNAYKWNWRLIAYTIMPNHYHLVVQTPGLDRSRLTHVIQSAHSFTAHHWRQEDPSIRTRIWWNFWESVIKDPNDLVQSIQYVHANCQLHGFCQKPDEYRFSSAKDYAAKQPTMYEQWKKDFPIDDLDQLDSF